ncbi:hypothetical protein BCR32DRAFT_265973 [Anaeromyces robustus]|uniref:Uncharacterized protein n=1 Tax=Anaeromyces robustus TaxID=1754192 RepID=A0A1Y1XHT3_9FUNG|nr:hypothetical protein BCR32DRAFT_265973 [Anaeromyces robustus]|eukprot:ORX84934.1 hypothetical protein BCR32DRAFT_265973 [Anaeromyces robustus]
MNKNIILKLFLNWNICSPLTCLCCCQGESSAIIYTFAMLVYVAILIIASLSTFQLIGTAIYIGILISLIVFTVGLFKKNLKYMIQFLYVFFIYLLLKTVIVVICILYIFNLSEPDDKKVGNMVVHYENDNSLVIGLIIVFIVIPYLVELYYYLYIGSYTKYIKKTIEKIDDEEVVDKEVVDKEMV